MNGKTEIKCIIFQCDNILIDKETALVSVMMDIASSYGKELEADDALRLFAGRSLENNLKSLAMLCGQPFTEAFAVVAKNKLEEEFELGLALVEGATNLLNQLDLTYCLVSNDPPQKLQQYLTQTKLDRFFKPAQLFANNALLSAKCYLDVAKAMGYLPTNCLVIENSADAVKACLAVNFKVLAFSNGSYNHPLELKDVITFKALAALPQLIELLNKQSSSIKN